MKPLKSAHVSDLHLGLSRLPAEIMCDGYAKTLFPHIPNIEFFGIEGDIFDKALGMSDASIDVIYSFLSSWLKLMDKHDVTVRVLRGTVLHERTQAKWLPLIHKELGLKNDIKYFDTVSLEYIERFDMRVAYLPDDLPYKSSDDVIALIKEMMAERGWDTIDYAFVHGYFEHVLPKSEKAKQYIGDVCYRLEQFDFVTRFIVSGHVHENSIHENMIYNGSTGRYGHGEQEAKGFILIDDDVTDAKITFVENVYAVKFDTYVYTDELSPEDVRKDVFDKLDAYPKDRPAHVRLKHPDANFRAALASSVLDHYPHITFTHEPVEKKKNKGDEIKIKLPDRQILQAPTPQALPHLVLAQLTSLGIKPPEGMSVDVIERLLKEAKS